MTTSTPDSLHVTDDVEAAGRRLGEVLGAPSESRPGTPETPPEASDAPPDAAPAGVGLTVVTSLLTVSAAGFVAGGVFVGSAGRVVGVLAALVGVGVVALSYRVKQTSLIQYLGVPVALVLGAALVVPDTRSGGANLLSLVTEALQQGGISQPPVPFDPGWRFLLAVLICLLGTAVTSLATSLGNPKLAVFLPVPVVFAALLVQPAGASTVPTVVALVLVVAAMTVAFGVELSQEVTGDSSARFELRRLAKGAAATGIIVALLAGVTQLGFLFPEPRQEQVVPPKRPDPPPPQRDRELFKVATEQPVPYRVGVLDVYDGLGWLTPPGDPSRLQTLAPDGQVPLDAMPVLPGATGPVEGGEPPAGGSPTTQTTFTASDIAGHILPTIANVTAVDADVSLEYDPRTQSLRLPEARARAGSSYTVIAPRPPGAKELSTAPASPERMSEFLEVPAPPVEVAALLAQAPENSFERLQFVRDSFYQKVIAAGAGNPIDVPPNRVVAMLEGAEATPYEITAAEALLARWAGVPARIGYGYFGGERVEQPAGDTPVFSIRPKDGSTWLEGYFEGYGWIPIVGRPLKAKASLSEEEKKKEPTIRPSDELDLIVYVPVQQSTIQLLYTLVRFWLLRTLPFLLAGILLLWLYPGVVKVLRRARRHRWAARYGLKERLAVAYAELRDAATDVNVGTPVLLPLEFVARVESDAEHSEVAWLVTRAMWGDLGRDLRVEDVEVAEEMCSSIRRRLRIKQSAVGRIIAFGSRKSLRQPHSLEVPNLWWPELSFRRRAAAGVRRGVRALRPRGLSALLSRPLPNTAVVIAVVLMLGGCVQQVNLAAGDTSVLPAVLVPPTSGEVRFLPEPSAEKWYAEAGRAALVTGGRVFSIRQDDEIVGSLQVAAFKPGLRTRREELRAGVIDSIGSGRFELIRIGTRRVYELNLPEQRMLLWFSPDGTYYQLLVARQAFEGAAELFGSILTFQSGEKPLPPVPEPLDPRRGSAG